MPLALVSWYYLIREAAMSLIPRLIFTSMVIDCSSQAYMLVHSDP